MRMQANDSPMSFAEALTGVHPESPREVSRRAYLDLCRRVWADCMRIVFSLMCVLFLLWSLTGTARYAATGWGMLGLALFIVVCGIGLRDELPGGAK